MRQNGKSGFTLIELSIVLVIIGLLVGGILAGKSLISSARLRSQLSQIEQYTTAAGVFAQKYGVYPGDMGPQKATAFGLRARLIPGAGHFNEDRLIRNGGWNGGGLSSATTEGLMFWTDLSLANLIADPTIQYKISSSTEFYTPVLTSDQLAGYWPKAKIEGTYIAAIYMSTGVVVGAPTANYFAVIGLYGSLGSSTGGELQIAPTISPADALAIDQKTDDGKPASGSILATSITNGTYGQYFSTRVTGANECFLTSGGVTIYNSAYDMPACAMEFKIQSLPL